MSEVSKRALALWLHWLDQNGVPRGDLVAGTPFRLQDLEDVGGRISWDDFALLSSRFEALVGGEVALRSVGRLFFEVPVLAPMTRIAGVLLDMQGLYDFGGRTIGESLFTPVESRIVESLPEQLVLQVRIREPYADVPSLFSIHSGFLEMLPTLLARPTAKVTMERRPAGAVYTVEVPARRRRSRVRRLSRYLRALRSPTLILDEIVELRRSIERGRAAQEQLAASEARWRAVAEAVGDLIAVIGTDGILQSLNRDLTDYPESFVGRSVADLCHPDDGLRFTNALEAVLQRGERQSLTLRSRVGSDGASKVFAVDLGPITINRRIVAVAAIGRDVTVEHRAEEERRTLELRVLHAERFESLGLFAGGIAHDFNNLLTVIRGNAELATLLLPSEAPARQSLMHIDAATARATELTGQLLAYAGRGRTDVQRLDLSAQVSEMGALLQSILPKSMRFERDLAVGLPWVEADPAKLQQIVMNLMGNAAEAIGEGDGTVTIRTVLQQVTSSTEVVNAVGPLLVPGAYVVVEVSDTGPGMDEATASKVFEPFFTTKANGHGLGLAAVAGIVRRHRGAMEVRSNVRSGTTFRLLLPAVPSEEVSDASDAPRASARVPAPAALVLVVDDEELVRETARLLLEHQGYRVLTAVDGDEGIALWDRHRDEILATVVDFAMPGKDGLEVCFELRVRDPEALVLLTSGRPPSDTGDPRSTPDRFLPKPWRPGDLVSALEEVCAVRG